MSEEIDWAKLGVPALLKFQTTLECPICKDILKNAPKITECGHTFCAECISRHLTTDNKCPSCRKPVYSGNLRANITVENMVDFWLMQVSPELFRIITKLRNSALVPIATPTEPMNNKEHIVDSPLVNSERPSHVCVQVSDSQNEMSTNHRNLREISTQESVKSDISNLVPCPICEQPFTILHLQTNHIDSCSGLATSPTRKKFCFGTNVENEPEFPLEKMPIPNLDMMSELKLRAKLRDYGLNTKGSKPVLKRRFQEWITIWNAARDGKTRTTIDELRKRMTKWDKAQEYTAPDMKKIDGKKWVDANKDSFESLVARARASKT